MAAVSCFLNMVLLVTAADYTGIAEFTVLILLGEWTEGGRGRREGVRERGEIERVVTAADYTGIAEFTVLILLGEWTEGGRGRREGREGGGRERG